MDMDEDDKGDRIATAERRGAERGAAEIDRLLRLEPRRG